MISIKTVTKVFTTALAAFALLVVPLLVVSSVSAQASITDCLVDGTELRGDIGDGCSGDQAGTGDPGQGLTDVIALVVNVISMVVGVLAVIMIIFGGMKYITSGGESNKITSAKNTIIYALIGLVIVALAQFIVRFVLQKAKEIS